MSEVWENAGSVVNWIVSVGAVVFAGLAVMYYGTVKVQKDHIAALEGRAVTREQALAEALTDKMKAETEAEVLRNIVTGEAHLVVIEGKTDEIRGSLREHHTEAMAGVDRITDLLSQIVEQGDG